MNTAPRNIWALVPLCLWTAAANAAPLTFNSALPVSSDEWIVREQFVYLKSTDDPTPMNRRMEVSGLMSVLGYGVTRDFAVFAMLPFSDKRLAMNAGGADVARSQAGYGDTLLMGRYTVYEDNGPGRTLRISPFLALEAPTGSDNAADRFGRLPPKLQPGSGTWDGQVGVVASFQSLDWGGDVQLAYRRNGEANGFKAGAVSRLDGSVQRRLWPTTLGEGVPGFLYGGLEVGLVDAGKDRVGAINDPNSGGTTLFLTPTVQYVTRRWVLEAGIQLPVTQRVHGTALENDYLLTGGFRLNFF